MGKHRKKSEAEMAQQFGLTLPAFLGILAALFYWGVWIWPEKPKLALGLLIAAPSVSLFAAALPWVWQRIFRGWMAVAEGISWVLTRVILSLFFFLVLTPFGVVMRLLGKTPLDLKWKAGESTYWVDKEEVEPTIERYAKQF